MDRKYLLSGVGYLLLGLLLGIHMASSKDHGQLVTHAHIMLVGFLLSVFYAICHRLWCEPGAFGPRNIQFILHQAGTLGLIVCLFLLYGGMVSGEMLGPILGVSSITVFIAAVMMKIDLVKSFKSARI